MKLTNILVAVIVATATLPLFAGDKDVSKELEELRAMLKQQNEKISRLQTKLDETKTGFAQVAEDEPVVKLGNKSKNLEIKGDLRVRYEQRDEANNDPSEEQGVDRKRRFRHRFRLGMKWKNDFGWSIAAGLATGGSDATSTNDTWSDGTSSKGDPYYFETGDIRLDYAYATHKWGNTSLAIGQQKNPFIHAGILFDGDMRPTGFTVQQGIGPGFLTAGAYNIRYVDDNEALGWMLGLQGGVKLKSDAVSATLALGYYVYNDAFTDEESLDDTDGELSNEDYRFELLDLYADVKLKLGDVGELKVYAQYTENQGAPDAEDPIDEAFTGSLGSQAGDSIDPEANNDAFVLGTALKIDRFKFDVAVIKTEADAMPGSLTDQDFGSGIGTTDVEGYRVKFGVGLTKNCSLGLTYLTYERQDEYSFDLHGNKDGEAELYQIDLKYKF